MAETRQIVVPGDVLDDSGRFRPGSNTYKDGSAIYASRLGVKTVRGDQINVIGLSGRYDPQRGDMVIGTVVETGPSNWYISVGASGDVGMHVNDVPWRVEFGETVKYLNTGDTVLLKVFHVDDLRKVQVTMKDRSARKLTGGIIIEVSPSKVPRIIGRNGSMITLVKNMTNTRMFVGQNGIIWLDGEPKDVALAISAIRMVEEQAHTTGLTENIKAWLEANGGVWREEVAGSEDEGPAFTPGEGAARPREFRERTEWTAPAREERPPRRDREDRGGRPFGDRRGGGGRGGDRRGGA
ncbi:MAG TPA: exosome complex RNA-binding protein Rrp4, partial [Candidatus Thermoplasmatota archaeon]|nr:exosome complex RNA-binding protein Rrp4 [Candidatus Thermoplasmatota archaeon]